MSFLVTKKSKGYRLDRGQGCRNNHQKVPVVVQWVKSPNGIHENVGSIPGLAQWVKDPELLWLWYRPAATAPNRPLPVNFYMPLVQP